MTKNNGRPIGSKGLNSKPVEQKIEALFHELFKTFKDDVTSTPPTERVSATIQLASLICGNENYKPNNK
jgi:hypothetical protein